MDFKLQRETAEEVAVALQDYVERELETSIGNLASENLLHFVIQQVAPHIYNQAIEDARQLIVSSMERLDEDAYALRRPLPNHRK